MEAKIEIGSLRTVLSLDATPYVQGAERAANANTRLRGNITDLDRSARSLNMTGVAQQFSQVAQQAMATGDPIRALAIQLPDIAGIMGGPLTIAAGVAAGALLPVAANFLAAGEKAATAQDALGDFNAALDDVGRYIDVAKTPLIELREEYGALAGVVQEAARRMVGIKVEEALGNVSGILDPLTGDIERAVGLMDQMAEQVAIIGRLEVAPFAQRDLEAIQTAQDTLSVINSDLTGLQSQLGLTAGEAERLGAGFEAMENAQSLDDLTSAAAGLLTWIDETYDSTERLPALLSSIYPYLNEIAASGARVSAEASGANVEVEAIAGSAAEAHANMLEMAGVDLARAFSDAKSPLQDLLDMLDSGQGILGRWGSAIAEYAQRFAPTEARYVGQIGTAQGDQMERLVAATTTLADQLGISAKDLLTVMSYETGGTFDPWQMGQTTQWGQHRGLIQMGEPQRAEFGYIQGDTIENQMEAIGRYLTDAGVKAGDSLLRVYAAINAGNPNAINASDANNGGAPGTVLDKVNEQMGGHLANAEALLSAYSGTVVEVTEEITAAEKARTEAEREAEQERDRIARETEATAKRELGYREDLMEASRQATADAEFERSIVGKSIEDQVRLRASHILTQQAIENGIDLNEQIAGSTQTYGDLIEETSIAQGRAAVETEAHTMALEAQREATQRAAAEMDAFAKSLTSMALGPITNNPIGGFLSSLPGFQTGAEGVFNGLLQGGFGGAVSSITDALGGATTGLAGLGTAIGAIAGPIGLGIGLFKGIMGSTEKLDEGLRVMLHGLDEAVVQTYETTKRTRLWGLMSSTSTDYDAADASLSDPINKAYAEIGSHILDLAKVMGKSAADFANFSTSFELSLDGMTDEQKIAAVQEEFGEVSDKLARMAGAAAKFGEDGQTATEILEGMVGSFQAVKAAYAVLFDENLKAGQSAVELAAKMTKVAGGLDAFAQSVQFYADNFLSLGDQAEEAAEAFRKGLKAANINAAPTTEEEFTALVDRLNDKGADKKMAALLALADEFVAWQDKLSAAQQEAVDKAAEAAREMQAIADQRYDLETQLLQAKGDTQAIRDRELAKLPAVLRDLQKAVWAAQDHAKNQQEAKDADAAADAAAEAKARKAKDEQQSLIERYYRAAGMYDQLRRVELSSFEKSNRAFAKAVMQQEERAGLEEEYLRLTGNTEELRRRELEALDPVNRGLQEMIWQLEDAKSAIDAMNQSDYASLFDYQRIKGLSGANLSSAPLPPALPTPDPYAGRREEAEDRKQAAADRREAAELLRQQRDLGVQMERHLYTLARLQRASAAEAA